MLDSCALFRTLVFDLLYQEHMRRRMYNDIHRPLPRVYSYTRVGDFDTPTHQPTTTLYSIMICLVIPILSLLLLIQSLSAIFTCTCTRTGTFVKTILPHAQYIVNKEVNLYYIIKAYLLIYNVHGNTCA